MSELKPADILLPNPDDIDMEKWAVIACDQYTSQPEYWQRVRKYVGDAPSTLHMILPEAELDGQRESQESGSVEGDEPAGSGLEESENSRIEKINQIMDDYLRENIFTEYKNAFIYVERTLVNGKIRKGVIGAADLEEYDYRPESVSAIRATEKTVEERIPPRKRIRKDAPVELPHILLLCDDDRKRLIESVTEKKGQLPKLYEFDLMEGGGHIVGWLLQGKDAEDFCGRLEEYEAYMAEKYRGLGNGSDEKGTLRFAVGDGNHSLATAKACYEDLKQRFPEEDLSGHPARYALVELENLHDSAQEFEPIHRIIRGVQPEELLQCMQNEIGTEEGYPVTWYMKDGNCEEIRQEVCGDDFKDCQEGSRNQRTSGKDSEGGLISGTLHLNPAKGEMAVAVLQSFLDEYLKNHGGKIDYIHGEDVVKNLASEEGTIGILLPAMEKEQLFRGVIADGALPRKTFSMGSAQEKRYYLEARKIFR